MVLLFLSVWAIVIALNEVLFAAQPFSMTSIAAAMPHTLMFSVVLSAAVYIAKKRIVDAVNKGRTIDKRFVAELTPEVGHQLNSMRRKLEAMDGGKSKTVGKKVKGKKKGRNFPSDSELSSSNQDVLKRNQESFDRIYENKVRNEQLKEHKEKAKVQARARMKAAKQAQEQIHDDSDYELISGGIASTLTQGRNKTGVVDDPNDFVKEAHAQMMEQAQVRMDAAKRQRTEHDLQEQRKSSPSMEESRARLAKEKELQKERREAQINALGELSQQERAAGEARRNRKAQMRAQEQEKAAAKARAEAQMRAEAQAKAQAKAAAAARAEAVAKEKAEQERRAMAKVRELAAAKERAAAAARERQEKEAQEHKAAIARSRERMQAQAMAAAAVNNVEVVTPVKDQHHMELEILQEQAKNVQSVNLEEPKKVKYNQEIDFIDQIEIPKGGLDTSSLKPYQMPKRGAGLDTSALKKVTLPPQSAKNRQLSPAQGVVGGAGGKMLNNRGTTLSNANLNQGQGKGGKKLSAQESHAAMNTALHNDDALERGQANTMEFANYQANARARALSRAQAPKAQAATKASQLPSAHNATPNKAMAMRKGKGAQQANAKQALGAKGPIGLGTTMEGMPSAYVPPAAPAKGQGSSRPSAIPLEGADVAPMADKASQVLPNDNLRALKRAGEIEVNAMPRPTDLMHAQENANTYMKMQSQSAPHAQHHKAHRSRPSQLLQSNEVV